MPYPLNIWISKQKKVLFQYFCYKFKLVKKKWLNYTSKLNQIEKNLINK